MWIIDGVETPIHPNLLQLSNSSVTTFHKCPRKYELSKLLPRDTTREDDGDEHTSFGHLVGTGIQSFLTHDDRERAIWDMYIQWPNYIDDESGSKSRKTFWHGIHALDRFVSFRKTILGNYKLAYLDGKPCTELGFSIDCGDGVSYRGKLDAALIDTMRNEVAVGECKTTKAKEVHPASFKHSGQNLGYKVMLDTLVPLLGLPETSSDRVNYFIYRTFAYEWEGLPFQKSKTQCALWIKNLLLDKKRVIDYATDNYFPMYGESCFDFFRPCQFFGSCELHNTSIFPSTAAPKVRVDKAEDYPYKFNLKDIIDAQLKMIG